MTIVSQNTSNKNAVTAFENLSKHFEITPEKLATANFVEIKKDLRVAGLQSVKSKTIKQVSAIVLSKYNGTIAPILSLPVEEARKELIALPGVDAKTADVVLLFSANRPVFPVDTHVNRVAKHLGFAPETGDCEIVRRSLQLLFDQRDYLAAHLLLISHGRSRCKARRPSCSSCPIILYCPSTELLNTT